jgi:hypothetical protein
MAKIKTSSRSSSPFFKKGDLVSFQFGAGAVTGQVIEDRGCLGVHGRRLYGINFEIHPNEPAYIEMPEEELTAGKRANGRPKESAG